MRNLLLMLVVAAAMPAAHGIAVAQPRPARPLPAMSYVLRVKAGPRGGQGMAAAIPTAVQGYTANAISAAGRGRLDVIEGDASPLFAKGDYVLFDSTDMIVVHPSAREYVPVPRDAFSKPLRELTDA